MASHVNTTSSAVNGSPSLQRRFFRSLNVQVLPSGEFVHDSARAGSTCCETASWPTKPANRCRVISRDVTSLAVMGLNVFGSPYVAMTRRPPGMPGGQVATSGGSGRGMLAAGVCGTAFFPQPQRQKMTEAKTAAVEMKFFLMRFLCVKMVTTKCESNKRRKFQQSLVSGDSFRSPPQAIFANLRLALRCWRLF